MEFTLMNDTTDHGFTITRDHDGEEKRGRQRGRQLGKPHPLPPTLLPVAECDLELDPEQLRPWVADLFERLQCPPDYIGVSVMAGAGALIGRKVLVRPHLEDDWAVVPNQWALCIGRPGVMKSPAMDEALRPIKQLTAVAEEKFNEDQARHAVAGEAAKLRRDENLRAAAKIIKKDRKADISFLLE